MPVAAVKYTGHGEKTGGLQAHSVGDTYPFMTVGTQHRYEGGRLATINTRYYVQNAATGQKYYWSLPGSEYGMTWGSIRDAEMVALQLANGWQGPCVKAVA